MAKTYLKGSIKPFTPNAAMLDVLRVTLPEAASQTFIASAPVVFSSGYIAVGSDPVTTVHGFALEAAHNSTAGAYRIQIIPAAPGMFLHLFGNLLTTAAADNVLAATDLGTTMNINYEATGGSDSGPIWHLGDSTSNAGVKVVSFDHDPAYIVQGQSEVRAVAGDTNARVTAVLLDAAADYAVA